MEWKQYRRKMLARYTLVPMLRVGINTDGAINHKEAIDYVEAVVANDEPFTEHIIKSIHQLVLKNIVAGRRLRQLII